MFRNKCNDVISDSLNRCKFDEKEDNTYREAVIEEYRAFNYKRKAA
jgi:hypothetical protein